MNVLSDLDGAEVADLDRTGAWRRDIALPIADEVFNLVVVVAPEASPQRRRRLGRLAIAAIAGVALALAAVPDDIFLGRSHSSANVVPLAPLELIQDHQPGTIELAAIALPERGPDVDVAGAHVEALQAMPAIAEIVTPAPLLPIAPPPMADVAAAVMAISAPVEIAAADLPAIGYPVSAPDVCDAVCAAAAAMAAALKASVRTPEALAIAPVAESPPTPAATLPAPSALPPPTTPVAAKPPAPSSPPEPAKAKQQRNAKTQPTPAPRPKTAEAPPKTEGGTDVRRVFFDN